MSTQVSSAESASDRPPPILPRRFRLGILIIILVALLAAHYIAYLRDNEARFYRLRSGMTQEEVEGILGKPDAREGMRLYWNFHDGTAWVWFDSDGKILMSDWKAKEHYDSDFMPFIRRLLRKIGL